MFGLFIGTLSLMGLIAMRRRRRFAHFASMRGFGYGPPFAWGWHGQGHGHGYGHGHRHGSRIHSGRRFLFEYLDTTPGQEKVIAQTVHDVREHLDGTGKELDGARKDLAAAVGGDVLDTAALRAAMARAESVVQKAADELTQSLPAVHAALDGEQRKRLAELIAEGRRGFRSRHWF